MIICPTTDDTDADVDEFQTHPPVGSPLMRRLEGSAGPVDLGRGLRLDRLPDDEAELVIRPLARLGAITSLPIKQFGQRFSFVRELGASPSGRVTRTPGTATA